MSLLTVSGISLLSAVVFGGCDVDVVVVVVVVLEVVVDGFVVIIFEVVVAVVVVVVTGFVGLKYI